MPYKEQKESRNQSQNNRREEGVSGAAQYGELGSVDRELDRLFQNFGGSPRRAQSQDLPRLALPQPGCVNAPLDRDILYDLSE